MGAVIHTPNGGLGAVEKVKVPYLDTVPNIIVANQVFDKCSSIEKVK